MLVGLSQKLERVITIERFDRFFWMDYVGPLILVLSTQVLKMVLVIKISQIL